MANLFWRSGAGTKRLLETPFKSEEEFETVVFEASDLLEDIFPLKRQIRGGSKAGIPDIVAVDSDGNVCIIEMKNVAVDANIIPQVLQYAIWAETNPDSIKSLWLECSNRPEDISIAWDDFQVRIIIVAPTVLRSTLALADKINYPIDLVEISRWIDGENHLLLVNRLEPEERKARPRPVAGLGVYDEAFYRTEYNPESATLFLKLAKDVQELVQRKGWNLETKFNKHYCGFKAGFFNAFGLKWVGSRSMSFFFKLTEAEARATGLKITKYESHWKEAYVYVDPSKTKVLDLLPLFEAAYGKLTGKTASPVQSAG
ncbi:MAG: hypothetical protein M3P26_10650 [Gemmatimonadota bacterium]|nr:hypothetical protein [Gemmatimonadota bacterium]